MQERDRITDHIQKDLSGRLQQSRQELTVIRQQMKGIFLTFPVSESQ